MVTGRTGFLVLKLKRGQVEDTVEELEPLGPPALHICLAMPPGHKSYSRYKDLQVIAGFFSYQLAPRQADYDQFNDILSAAVWVLLRRSIFLNHHYCHCFIQECLDV